MITITEIEWKDEELKVSIQYEDFSIMDFTYSKVPKELYHQLIKAENHESFIQENIHLTYTYTMIPKGQ